MKTDINLPSRFAIGEPVYIQIGDQKFTGNIRTIIFSNMKVRYSVSVIINFDKENEEEERTTLHNIDSVFIKERTDGKIVDFGEDNYS